MPMLPFLLLIIASEGRGYWLGLIISFIHLTKEDSLDPEEKRRVTGMYMPKPVE